MVKVTGVLLSIYGLKGKEIIFISQKISVTKKLHFPLN